MNFILYSKPDCCLCTSLLEKLRQIPELELEVRDIATNLIWFEKYQFTIPVVCAVGAAGEVELSRISPRASVDKIQELLWRSQPPFPSE